MSFHIKRTIEDLFANEDKRVRELLIKYLIILFKWHEVNNIISSSDSEYIIKREIYDSYLFNAYLNGDSYTDIGSGGGIPGILIALLNPNKKVILIDRKTTFIDFLLLAKAELGLDNIEIIKADVLKTGSIFTTDTVILKNFSNKIISKMNYEDKFVYLMRLIKKNELVSKAYMLTGSPVLELSNECLREFTVTRHVICSPFFENSRVVAEVKFENTIDS